jgi:hypothetical protein
VTIYYICKASDLAVLELSQTSEEHLACEIISAAFIFEERASSLLAIEADSENGTYAQLKGVTQFSMELTISNIHIWKTEGVKIYEYLLGPGEEKSHLWGAFGILNNEIENYEELCGESTAFDGLGMGLSNAMMLYMNENIREEQTAFSEVLKNLYAIEEIDVVSS